MNTTPPIDSQNQGRIVTVDVLRGMALFGILFAHMTLWYAGGALPQSFYTSYQDILSGLSIAICMIFFTGKFFAIFSFLFGLSFYIQMNGLAKRHENVALRFGWRLAILGVIGFIHHLFWAGDILTIYVPLGFLLLFARHLSDRIVLVTGIIFVFNLPTKLIECISILYQHDVNFIKSDMKTLSAAYFSVVNSEQITDMLIGNFYQAKAKLDYQLSSGRLFITFGFFLLGMYAGRKQFFSQIEEHIEQFKYIKRKTGFTLLGVAGVGIIAAITIGALAIDVQKSPWIQWGLGFLLETFNVSLTIFYITTLALMMQTEKWQRKLLPLANIGKMALTSYLTQTAIGLFLYFNIGLHWVGLTSPAANVIFCLMIFTAQIHFSRWWLTRFNYGPIEWLWRSGTYLKWQPLIKTKSHQVSAVEI